MLVAQGDEAVPPERRGERGEGLEEDSVRSDLGALVIHPSGDDQAEGGVQCGRGVPPLLLLWAAVNPRATLLVIFLACPVERFTFDVPINWGLQTQTKMFAGRLR